MRSSEFFSRAYGTSVAHKNGRRPSTKTRKPKGSGKLARAPKAKSSSDAPNKNWNLEQLTDYVRQHLRDREEMHEQLASIGRKSAVALFHAGHGLHLLREKLKATSAWEQWLTDRKIGKGTANEAIRLYYKATALWKARAEVELAKRTITEAKCELEVIDPEKKQKKEVPLKRNKTRENDDQGADMSPPPEITRADEYLVAMVHKLEDVVKWDRGDLDADQLDRFARRCIDLLGTFLMQKTALAGKKNNTKRKSTNAA